MEAPDWFLAALAAPCESRKVAVAGAQVHYLRWGDPADAPIVLVHGGSAHARWWAFLAPLLAAGQHVVAVDLSGHGESDWRSQYSYDGWADELIAIGEHAGFRSEPVIVGHSMGGVVTMHAAARHALAGAIIVDSPVRRPDPESEEGARGRMFRRPKTYPDLDTAMRHFHLVPPQPRPAPYIDAYVARHSLHPVEGGWTWKFDPKTINREHEHDYSAVVKRIRCRVAIVRAEFSEVVPRDMSDLLYELLGRNAPLVEIPQAWHHVLLDQPLALVTCLRALLADWQHSVPRSRR